MGPKGPLRAKRRSFGDRNIFFGKQAQSDKAKQKKLLFLKVFVFDEFSGPLKGVLRGPKGPLWAKSRSFGDRNIFFGKQAQCDKVKNVIFDTADFHGKTKVSQVSSPF